MSFDLGRSGLEEDCTKCNKCSTGLSPIESMLYGNRCVWCGKDVEIPSLRKFLLFMYYEYRIYKLCRELKRSCIDNKTARILYLGALGVYGFNNFVKVKTLKDRKNIIKELRYILSTKSEGKLLEISEDENDIK